MGFPREFIEKGKFESCGRRPHKGFGGLVAIGYGGRVVGLGGRETKIIGRWERKKLLISCKSFK